MFDVFNSDAVFVMRAPISTIRTLLKLHPAAVARIEHETKDNGICELHLNSWGPWNKIMVQAAVGNR